MSKLFRFNIWGKHGFIAESRAETRELALADARARYNQPELVVHSRVSDEVVASQSNLRESA